MYCRFQMFTNLLINLFIEVEGSCLTIGLIKMKLLYQQKNNNSNTNGTNYQTTALICRVPAIISDVYWKHRKNPSPLPPLLLL